MALQHLRSSTAHKRPIPTVMSAGQIAINTNEASPGLFFKDSNGDLVKVGPVHIGTTAPNSSPASVAATALVTGTVYQILTVGTSDFTLVGASANTVGTVFTATGTTTGTGTVSGQQGVEKGEQWLDTTGGAYDLKIYDGTDWRSQAGEFVNITGDTMTGDLAMDNADIVLYGSSAALNAKISGTGAGTLVLNADADNNGTTREIQFKQGTSDVMRIDSSGNCGIGNTSPGTFSGIAANNLVVGSGSGTEGITVYSGSSNSGNIAFADGTTGNEQYRGIINYNHSTDTMVFNTASAERMRIDSSGNVGIGEDQPIAKLQLTDASAQPAIVIGREPYNTYGSLLLGANSGLASHTTPTGTSTVQVAASKILPGNGDITFYTSPSAAAGASRTFNERMRIDSSGNVGIGTTSPGDYLASAHQLVISDAASTGITIATPTSSSGTIAFADGTGAGDNARGLIRYGHSDNSLQFSTNAGERLRIDSSGNVGVGTSSPVNLLQLNKSDSGSVYLHCTNSTTGATANDGVLIGLSGSEELTLFNRENNDIKFGTNDTEQMRIKSTGNVGIGQTDPAQLLHLTSTGSNAFLQFSDSGSGGSAAQVRIGSNGNDLVVLNNTSSNTATERMRIDSNGNVGIGASSITNLSGYAQLALEDSNGGFIDILDDGVNQARIIGSGNELTLRAANTGGEISFDTNGNTERMRIDSSGNVGIGTADPNYELHVHDSSGSATIQLTNGTVGSGSSDGARITASTNGILYFENLENAATVFTTNNTERMRIDSSGRLLVGATSTIDVASTASAKLQVTHAANSISAAFYSTVNANGPAGVLALGHGRGSVTGILSNNDVMGQIRFAGADGTDLETVGAQISAEVDGTPGANDMPGRLMFSTTEDGNSSPTERMRITSIGQARFVADNNVIDAGTKTSAGTTDLIYQGVASRTGIAAGGITVFKVFTNGNTQNTNNSYGAISDSKLKENIVDASSQWDDIKGLRIRNYNFIEGQTHTQIGVVAQEVETVSPGLVFETPDRNEEGNDLGTVTKSVNYSVLYMKAVKALQEAMDRIETLEAKVAALEAA